MTYRKGPPENTLVLNTTHQMLRYFEAIYRTGCRHLVAFSPNRRWENLFGYDVKVSFLKATVFQYKRPKVPVNSNRPNAYRRFSINRDQWLTLLLLFEPGQAFFTLTEVMNEPQLEDSMNRTIFLDVYGILPDTSLVYTPPNTAHKGVINDFLIAKIRNGPKYAVHPNFVFGWQNIADGIDQCNIGLPIITEEQITEEFSSFESRIGQVDDFAEQNWRTERLNKIMNRQLEEYVDFYLSINEARNKEFSPEEIYGINPLQSQSWGDVTNLIPNTENSDKIHQEIQSYIKRDSTVEHIHRRLNEVQERKLDPTTYRIQSSQINLFSK